MYDLINIREKRGEKMVFKYKIENLSFPELEERAVVPKFQRKLVWSTKEKESFIETLSKGYPFGAILIYKYENEEKYSIIDGLQRYTTIRDYVSNPEKYIDFEEVIDNDIVSRFINVEMIPESTYHNVRKKINEIIQQFIKNIPKEKSPTSVFHAMLKREVPEFFSVIDVEKYQELERITNKIMNKIKNHLNVESLPIPTIIFTGEVEELATVFENLNRGGKKLSKYQVFAAQWSKHELKLTETPLNIRILDITIQRYENLIESRKVEINNFSREEMLENKTINIAEFCYALGKLITEKMYVFWDKDSEDTANQIGYSTLALVFGIKNKDMNTLVKYFDKLDNPVFIEKFVNEILNIYRDINDRFSSMLKVPGISSNTYYGGKQATDFQLLSFFGSLWATKFGDLKSGELVIQPGYKVNYKRIEKNLTKYYVFDIVNSRWSGAGDSKLDNIVIDGENYYLRELKKSRFEQGLFDWHDEVIGKNSINFEPVSKMLYTLLSSFYVPYYTEKKYDSEHIIARKYINKIRNESNRPIPGGSLGNHMYLDTNNNRSKQEFSLYDMEKAGYKLEESFVSYQSYPSRKEFGDIKVELHRSNGDYDQLIKTIERRGEYLINDLVSKLYP